MTIMVEREQDIRIPDLLDDIAVPEGWRVEYIEGEIRVSPTAVPRHNVIAARIMSAINRSDIGREAFMGIGYCKQPKCADLSTGNHVIPDVSVTSREFTEDEHAAANLHSSWISADSLDMVVEVTSTNRFTDTISKFRAYGRMSVPYYLLVDRRDHVTTLFSDPTGDVDEPGYDTKQSFPFGQDVQLPAPYPTLSTKTWQ
jgi:Uma2 family endonuclease